MRLVRYLFPKPDFRDFRLNPSILLQAASLYGLKAEYLTPVRSSTSFVYSYSETGFLKITPSSEQSYERIGQVCKWQSYLASETPLVVPVIPSVRSYLVEKIESEAGYYTVVLYEKAIGSQVTSADWNTDMFVNMGKLTGNLHRITKNYKNFTGGIHLPHYHVQIADEFGKYLPAENSQLIHRFGKLLKTVGDLPVSQQNYGIIHGDIHRGNLNRSGDKLQLFDFDDTCYSWFINDIAVVFYNALLNGRQGIAESAAYLESFTNHFWHGYNMEHSLPAAEKETLPLWIAIKAIINYEFLIKTGASENHNPTHRAFFLLNEKYATQELEQLKPELFC